MPFTPVSARLAKVRIGTVVFTANKWTVTPTGDELDTTNFEGAGFGDRIIGVVDCEAVVEADWDSAANNFALVFPGAVLSTVKLYLNDTTGSFYSFPVVLVTQTPTTAEVRGKLQLTITFKNKGIYAMPA